MNDDGSRAADGDLVIRATLCNTATIWESGAVPLPFRRSGQYGWPVARLFRRSDRGADQRPRVDARAALTAYMKTPDPAPVPDSPATDTTEQLDVTHAERLSPNRFPILDVQPTIASGVRPIKAAVGEAFDVSATVFREGHDALGVSVVLIEADGTESRVRAAMTAQDRWTATVRPSQMGAASFVVEAWDDPWGTWHHNAGIKVPAGVDVELELLEGALLLELALKTSLQSAPAAARAAVQAAVDALRNTTGDPEARLAVAFADAVDHAMHTHPVRDLVSPSQRYPVKVERRRALVGSWYEFFPRSEGSDGVTSGTFATAAKRLQGVADMGFDIVYLPPIHPVGVAHRKGPNNSLTPAAGDPGSPWAVGGAAGGHDAVHPDLGTIDDFDAFVAEAARLGMEIALDLALQASPDHPWVKSHPEWFKQRADGSIAYAENPPKKYQDIYPMFFDTDPEGLYNEIERVVRYWMDHGVRVFRVDNPHTKPVWMWERLIAAINATDPDVIFLAEAFTRPAMMRVLGEVGFQQSYTYFTWRNDKHGLEEYLTELGGKAAAYMRPNFFPNTPDILHEFLQKSGPAGFAIRATLAATMVPTYGIYAGFELYEGTPVREGSEEYLDSEKYQFRPRDWQAAVAEGRSLAPYLTVLNRIRREHPALQTLRGITFHETSSPSVIAYSRKDHGDVVITICTLNPKTTERATVKLNMPALGADWDAQLRAQDLVSDAVWTWGREVYVELDPFKAVAHIVSVRSL